MRIAHAAGTEGDPRAEMRALAAEFPGALRELDELPLAEIEARVEALSAPPPPTWAPAMARYHGWMRLGLAVKRRFPRDSAPSEVHAWLRAQRPSRAPEPRVEELTVEAVGALLRPPGGRLSRWVLARIARDTDRAVEDVEAEVFKCMKTKP